MASASNQIVGTKGSDVYDSTGSPLLDLSVLLVRGADESMLRDLMNKVLSGASTQMEDDAFVLAFQTRDVRGGKGERDLFTTLFKHLLNTRPSLALKLVDLIPEYGSWRDIMVLFKDVISYDASLRYTCAEDFRSTLFHIVKTQLEKDEADMAEKKSVSLLAKWLPREGSEDDILAKWIARALSPEATKVSICLKNYRKRIVALNKHLETTEVKMCAKQFATIEPSAVPGRCLAQHMKAFLNEKAPKMKNQHVAAGQLRHPDDPDRMECRKNFVEHLAKAAEGKAKVNGAVTRYPHEVIKKMASSFRAKPCYCWADDCVGCEEPGMSTSELQSLIAVWNDMVKKAKEAGGLGRTIAMCDFSGSMQSSASNKDTPYWVSMAMGLLISELTSDEFKDTFMTFDSQPQWHTLPEGDIFKRYQSISQSLGQGLSTDFQKALDMVLATLKAKRVRPGEEPKDLIVITDMNWDKACASHEASVYTGNRYRHVVKTDPWQTHIQMAREAFKRAGEDMWGIPWTPPRIVIWNVAATSSDFHAQKNEEGVIHLSGWSPSLFKVLVEEGAKVQTPMDALRVILEADRYQPIRDRLAAFRPPVPTGLSFKGRTLNDVREELRLEDA